MLREDEENEVQTVLKNCSFYAVVIRVLLLLLFNGNSKHAFKTSLKAFQNILSIESTQKAQFILAVSKNSFNFV